VSEPDHRALEVQDSVQGAVRVDGPIVVVTAMSLKPAVREALADRLGPGHIVRDIRDAGHRADVVLVPAVSGQLVGGLREMFPGARILVTELSDVEFGLDLPGPVSRIMRSGVDGYFVAPDLGHLAAATREAARGDSVAALTTGRHSSARWELQAQDERRCGAVLRLVVSPESGFKHEPPCFVLNVSGWLQQLHPDGAEPADRLRCMELAWTTALQLLDGGIDVAVSGVDHEVWQLRAQRTGITVVDER
jgi:hypothetical protein